MRFCTLSIVSLQTFIPRITMLYQDTTLRGMPNCSTRIPEILMLCASQKKKKRPRRISCLIPYYTFMYVVTTMATWAR